MRRTLLPILLVLLTVSTVTAVTEPNESEYEDYPERRYMAPPDQPDNTSLDYAGDRSDELNDSEKAHYSGLSGTAGENLRGDVNNSLESLDVTLLNATCGEAEYKTSVPQKTVQIRDDNGYDVQFTGVMGISTPCHTVNHTVEQVSPGKYVLTVDAAPTGEACTACVGTLTYRVDAAFDNQFVLTVNHGNETVHEISRWMETAPVREPQNKSVLDRLVDWFRALF